MNLPVHSTGDDPSSISRLHPGHRELLKVVWPDLLFRYDNVSGLWHVLAEIVDVNPERNLVVVAVYAQGGPHEAAPDVIKPIAEAVPYEWAMTAARRFVADVDGAA